MILVLTKYDYILHNMIFVSLSFVPWNLKPNLIQNMPTISQHNAETFKIDEHQFKYLHLPSFSGYQQSTTCTH